MSDARECDICGALHKREPGVLSLDVHVVTTAKYDSGWSEIDLCKKCSDRVLAIIKPALDEFDDIVRKNVRRKK